MIETEAVISGSLQACKAPVISPPQHTNIQLFYRPHAVMEPNQRCQITEWFIRLNTDNINSLLDTERSQRVPVARIVQSTPVIQTPISVWAKTLGLAEVTDITICQAHNNRFSLQGWC